MANHRSPITNHQSLRWSRLTSLARPPAREDVRSSLVRRRTNSQLFTSANRLLIGKSSVSFSSSGEIQQSSFIF